MFRARELLLGVDAEIDNETAGDDAGPSIVAEGNEFIDLLYHDRRHIEFELPPHRILDNPFAECPVWGLPFFVEDNHVVREGLLLKLQEVMAVSHEAALTVSQKFAACHGFGGVGKTQMARYYCEFVQQQTPAPYRFVGWVQGSDEESVKRNLIALGQGLGLVAYDCKPDIALAQIKTFFEHNDGWLLVFDDIQDTEWLDDLLPHGVGHVLVTTRNEHWNRGETIPVDVMTPEEAITLLERISEREDPAFETIAEQLGYLPLALVQAASFIRLHVEPDESAEIYHTLYDETVAQRALLDYEKFPLGQLHDPVTIAWLMNFERLQETSPHAIRLLQAICFLHHNNIPWGVLIRFIDEDNAYSDEARWLVQNALADLSDYSLIQNDVEQQQLSVHVLVHGVSQWYLQEKSEARLRESFEVVLYLMLNFFDFQGLDHDNWCEIKPFAPHAQATVSAGDSVIFQDQRIFELSQKLIRYYNSVDLPALAYSQLQRHEAWANALSIDSEKFNELIFVCDQYATTAIRQRVGYLAVLLKLQKLIDNVDDLDKNSPEYHRIFTALALMYGEYGSTLSGDEKHEQLSQSMLIFQSELEWSKAHGEIEQQIACYANMGIIFLNLGDTKRALLHWEKALAVFDEQDEPSYRAKQSRSFILANISQTYLTAEEPFRNLIRAKVVAKQNLSIWESRENREENERHISWTHYRLGLIACEEGDLEEARLRYDEFMRCLGTAYPTMRDWPETYWPHEAKLRNAIEDLSCVSQFRVS